MNKQSNRRKMCGDYFSLRKIERMFTANTTAMFIHQHSDWHLFRYDHDDILSLLATVRNMQGRLVGRMESLGFSLREEAMLTTHCSCNSRYVVGPEGWQFAALL